MAEEATILTHRAHAPLVARVLREFIHWSKHIEQMGSSFAEKNAPALASALAEAGWPYEVGVPIPFDAIVTTGADLLESLARQVAALAEPLITDEIRLAATVARTISARMKPDDFVGVIARAYAAVYHGKEEDDGRKLASFALLIGLLVVDESRKLLSGLPNRSTGSTMEACEKS